MSLTAYRTLGRSGLVVSPLALGTMTFGPGEWGADDAASRAMFDAYRDAGGNFVDTADIYTGGASETLIGQFIRDTGSRDEIVLATKFGFNGSASPLEAKQASRGNPNAGGTGAKNILRALDASLKRLGTDYIDLYWMHIWDGVTPVEEIVQTLGDLVRAGKIRYYGLSDMPAWVAMKAATIAAERRVPGPIAIQVEYSLVARDIEGEHVPVAHDAGLGVMPWSPLAGGFLSGKYKREDTSGSGRLSGANPFGNSKFAARNWDVLEVLTSVAAELGRPAAQVALAWVMGRPGVASTLIGARTPAQLASNIAAGDIRLSPEQLGRLDAGERAGPGVLREPGRTVHPPHGVRRERRYGVVGDAGLEAVTSSGVLKFTMAPASNVTSTAPSMTSRTRPWPAASARSIACASVTGHRATTGCGRSEHARTKPGCAASRATRSGGSSGASTGTVSTRAAPSPLAHIMAASTPASGPGQSGSGSGRTGSPSAA